MPARSASSTCFERLRQSRPDGYEVFHSMVTHSAHGGADRDSEIDLVLLAPNGKMLPVNQPESVGAGRRKRARGVETVRGVRPGV